MYTQGPIAVSGYGPYTTTNTSVFITADGTYSWEVTYSGDGNNNGAFSSCEAEQQVVNFTPLITRRSRFLTPGFHPRWDALETRGRPTPHIGHEMVNKRSRDSQDGL